MAEHIHIDFRPLFEVEILHGYHLSRGTTELHRLSATQRVDALAGYDIRGDLLMEPTADCRSQLNALGLHFRATATGILVAAPVRLVSGPDGWVPERELPADLKLRFALRLRDPGFLSITNLRLDLNPGIYRFGNDLVNQDPAGLHLSRPLGVFDDQAAYKAGDLVLDDPSNPTRRYLATSDLPAGPFQESEWSASESVPARQDPPYAPGEIGNGDQVSSGGLVYQALSDDPGDDLSDTTGWQLLYPVSLQAVSAGDFLPITGVHLELDVRAASTGLVDLEIRDRTDAQVRTARQVASSSDPLTSIQADLSRLPPGTYRIRLLDSNGQVLRDAGNAVLAQADQDWYLDPALAVTGAFGVIEIGAGSGAYALLDGDGRLNQPRYTIRLLNRHSHWRYHLSAPLTQSEQDSLSPLLGLETPQLLATQQALPLSRGLIEIMRPGGEQLFPNPAPRSPLTAEGGRIYSDIHMTTREN